MNVMRLIGSWGQPKPDRRVGRSRVNPIRLASITEPRSDADIHPASGQRNLKVDFATDADKGGRLMRSRPFAFGGRGLL